LGHPRSGPGATRLYTKIIEAAKKEGKVVIYATTDAVAANPLIKDFETLSTELYNRFIAEADGTADLLWSSAMELQVKLVADGKRGGGHLPNCDCAGGASLEFGLDAACRLPGDGAARSGVGVVCR
jgi:hypothetical protein